MGTNSLIAGYDGQEEGALFMHGLRILRNKGRKRFEIHHENKTEII